MDGARGSMGTAASLSLRLGQAFFSVASLLFMYIGDEFYSYTAFCFLITIMGLLIPWSAALAIVEICSLFVRCRFTSSRVMVFVVLGDWSLSILSLAAACSTAGVVDVLVHINGSYCPAKYCGRYQLSAAMAFLSWVLTAASSLLNLWLMASW